MLAVKLRKEIVDAANTKNEQQLVSSINPVISWNDFKPPEGPNIPAKLGGLEGDPDWFFSHTYPTTVIKEVLKGIKEKNEGIAPGVFPLDGYLGSGKSHALLTLYHIFNHPNEAASWLQKWNIDFPKVEDAIIIPVPLQNVSYKDLWTPFFKALGKEIDVEEGDWPKSNQIKRAIGDQKVIMLIDEIDNWYDAKSSQEKARVRGFLQSLAEASEDPTCQLNLVVTFLGLSPDVKVLRDIVARPRGGSSIVMQRVEDNFDIVRFRLFESIDEDKMNEIILDYLKKVGEELRKKGLDENLHLRDELRRAYPFHPSFLRTLSSLKVRQMLVMLAMVVIRKLDKVNLIITSDLDDDLLRAYLHSANPKIVDAYFEDIDFVKNTKEVKEGVISFELARAILITSVLNTTETKKGADIKDIIFSCVPKYKAQDIDDTISFLEKWTRLKKNEEDGIVRYVITTDLPVPVKIERRAELVPIDDALKIVKELVKKTVSSEIRGYKLIFDPSEISNDKRLKILTLLEKPSDFSSIYPPDFTNKNTLYLLYPAYSLKSDETIKLAKRIIASSELEKTEEPKKYFKDFYNEYMRHLKKQIDNAGWRGFRWFRKNFKDERMPGERTITNLKDVDDLIKNYGSKDLLKYFLNGILEEQEEISVRDLKERLYRLEGAPILLKDENLLSLLAEMEKNGEIAIKTKQGKTWYKESISYQIIGDEDIIQKPPETAVPPTTGDVNTLVRDKRKLPYTEYASNYPFIDDEILEKVYISSISSKDGIFVIEENKIVSRPSNIKLSALIVKEEAAKVLEPLILKIVNEKVAIKIPELSEILKETYQNSGITGDLVLTACDNLEIGAQIHILRRKDAVIIQLPEEKLIEEVRKRIFFEVKKAGEINKEILIEELSKIIPTEKKAFDDAIASLIDDGKLEFNKETKKLLLPKKGGSLPPQPRRILLKEEGKTSEIVKRIEEIVEDGDIVENIRIEIINDLPARELKEILEKVGDMNIKLVARRKEL